MNNQNNNPKHNNPLSTGSEPGAASEALPDGNAQQNDALVNDNQGGPGITNNDGSVIETLDTVLHGTPGFITGHSAAGSNRADYYEANSNGQSDAAEETAYLKKMQEKNT